MFRRSKRALYGPDDIPQKAAWLVGMSPSRYPRISANFILKKWAASAAAHDDLFLSAAAASSLTTALSTSTAATLALAATFSSALAALSTLSTLMTTLIAFATLSTTALITLSCFFVIVFSL